MKEFAKDAKKMFWNEESEQFVRIGKIPYFIENNFYR
jgi:hypothetical protein